MAYYTLVTRDDQEAPWAPQFGDYDRASVLLERRDCYAHIERSSWKIVRTETAHQWRIDREIKALNSAP